jgi:hypothetical protein
LSRLAADGFRGVENIGAGHGELTQHRHAVIGHRGADARNDRVIARQAAAIIIDRRRQRVDRHGAARRVDHLRHMALRLGGLFQALGGIVLRLARQDRDPQRTVHRFAARQVLIEIIAQGLLRAGLGGADHHVVKDRGPAQQHAIRHALAIGQRDLDRPGALANGDIGFDHPAQLRLAI